MKVLLIGESWFTYSVHQKGFDVFHTSEYVEGASKFINDLKSNHVEVTYVPAHKIDSDVPNESSGLEPYDAIIISDVGANSFLLGRETFFNSKKVPNKLEAILRYVEEGGGLLMVGGYMSFSGIDAKARYGSSPLKKCLPVNMLEVDDRVELPEGITPLNSQNHDIVKAFPKAWPYLLGYNKLEARPKAQTLVRVGNDPLLVIGEYKLGRTATFASDLAPHWAPEQFMNWDLYPKLWMNIIEWLSKKK